MKTTLASAVLTATLPALSYAAFSPIDFKISAPFAPIAVGPEAPFEFDVPQVQPRLVGDSIITPALWKRLPAPSAEELAWLTANFKWINPEKVRVVTLEEGRALMEQAVARQFTSMDMFTDAGLRGDLIYYMPRPLVEQLFGEYEIQTLIVASGITHEKKPFHIQGLVLGASRVEALYDVKWFKYKNQYFPDYRYVIHGRVSQVIESDTKLAVSGINVEAPLGLRPRIKYYVKIGKNRLRVETDVQNKDIDLGPIIRKTPQPNR